MCTLYGLLQNAFAVAGKQCRAHKRFARMNRAASSGRLSGLCLLPSQEMETSTANSAHCLSKSQPPHPLAACSVTPLDPLPGLAQLRHCVQPLKGTSEGQRIAHPPLFRRRSGGGGVRGREGPQPLFRRWGGICHRAGDKYPSALPAPTPTRAHFFFFFAASTQSAPSSRAVDSRHWRTHATQKKKSSSLSARVAWRHRQSNVASSIEFAICRDFLVLIFYPIYPKWTTVACSCGPCSCWYGFETNCCHIHTANFHSIAGIRSLFLAAPSSHIPYTFRTDFRW